MMQGIQSPTLAGYTSLARYAAPAGNGGSSAQQDTFVSRYVDNVKNNFREDGVGGTLLASGVHGLIGGILGGVGGALVGAVLPSPVGHLVASTCQIAGAAGGFLYRLGRKDD